MHNEKLFCHSVTIVYLTLAVGVAKTTLLYGPGKHSSLFSFTFEKFDYSLNRQVNNAYCGDLHEIVKIEDDLSGDEITNTQVLNS